MERARAKRRELTAQRAAMGMCRRCFRPAIEGKRVCKAHALKEAKYKVKERKRRVSRYAERRAAGVCVTCGVNRTGGPAKCRGCAMAWSKYKRAVRARWAAAGRCEECGGRKAVPNATRCFVCLDRRTKPKHKEPK